MNPDNDKLGAFTTPLSARGIPIWFVYLISIVGLIYLLNPTAGVLEVIPDNLPFIGNLDEGMAAILLWYGIVEFFEGGRFRE